MRDETFTVADGFLVRRVITNGRPYQHRCPLAAYERIAIEIDDLKGAVFTQTGLVERFQAAGQPIPSSQIAAATAFLEQRGVLDAVAGGRKAATPSVRIDAMIEFHALRE